MKRFANVRFPTLIAVALICGILCGYLFFRSDISLIYINATLPAAAVICILCAVFSKKKPLIYCIAVLAFIVIGAVGSYFKLDTFDRKELSNGDTCYISAKVCDKGKYDSGEYLIIKNITADGKSINGKMKAYLPSSYSEFCDNGYTISFNANVTVCDAFPYGKLNYNVFNNVKYSCRIYGDVISEYRFSLLGSINSAIRNSLYDKLDYDTASIAYAMLTGNADNIEDGTYAAFRYGGVAHIFAVSGLHIGIIYGLLLALSKKLRLNRYVAVAVCIMPILLYAGVCGFTVSSVRALITCVVAAIARAVYAKYDALNSLSIATTAILLFNPLNLFNIGFQLSVGAVSGIVLLSKSLIRPFKKIPRKLKNPVGISLSAQAGTLPVMLARFGYLSGAGILLNIFVLPLLSAVFVIIFTATAFSLLMPFAARFILPYAALPLEVTVSFLTNAGFEKSLISGFGAGAFIPIYYLGLLFLSDKFNLKPKSRLIGAIGAATVLFTYIPLKTFYPFNDCKVIVSAYYGGGEVLFKSRQGTVLVITEGLYPTRIDALLNEYYSSNLDALVILGSENCAEIFGTAQLNCNAYVYKDYVNIQPYKDKTIIYEKSFSINGIDFTFVDGYSLLADYGSLSVGIGAGNFVPFEYCDLLITDSTFENACETSVSFNERTAEHCVYDDGDFTFKLKN